MDDKSSSSGIPNKVRERVIAELKAACSETGSFPVNQITSRALSIKWGDYANGAKKLGEWLDKNFPEFKRVGETIFLPESAAPSPYKRITPEVRGVLATILNEIIDDNQSVLLARLGDKIAEKKIDRHAYTDKGLGDWIVELFPAFHKSDSDRQRLFRGAVAPPPPQLSTYPPAAKALSMVDLDEDIRQMHAIAFMGWWNNNIRTLKNYTGCSGNDTRIWSGIFAQKMSDVLLGRCACVQGCTEEGNPRVAFDSGIETADGRPIYCVLIPNQINKNGKLQPFALEALCSPGDQGNAELGAWLEKHVSQQRLWQAGAENRDVMELEACCTRLEAMGKSIIPKLETALQVLRDGTEFSDFPYQELSAYQSTWKNIGAICSNLEVPRELASYREILHWCTEKNQSAQQLKQIERLFEALLESLKHILETYHITFDDPSDDWDTLRSACAAFRREASTKEINNALLPYQQLFKVMGTLSVSPELLEITAQLDGHFGFRTMQVFCLKLINAEQYQLYQQKFEALAAQIKVLDVLYGSQQATDQLRREIPSASELLSDLCNGKAEAIWSAGGGMNQLETLILEDRLPEALAFAADSSVMSGAGYTEDDQERILSRLSAPQSLPEGHSLYNAGRRLSMILGERNSTAERYFLMGLYADTSACSTELSRLYRRHDQAAKFDAFWPCFGSFAEYSLENHIYYIHLLKDAPPEKLKAYIDNHVFLCYLPECAEAILSAAEGTEFTQLRQDMTSFLQRLGSTTDLNKLEQALAQNCTDKVLELLNNRGTLLNMGYSEEQITQISQAVISDAYPAGQEPFEVGTRIYLFQGNLHSVAERYLWQGFANNPSAAAGDRLIQLLADEQRWTECIRLYNSCASKDDISTEGRQAYMLSMLHTEPVKLQQLIRVNLQDFMSLMYHNQSVRAAVDSYRTDSGETSGGFYQSICTLGSFLSEDYPRSVILHNRDLRDMVTQPKLLSELGLDDEQAERARTLYQSGNYSRGTDALSIARRVYAFLGTYHDIAENFCLFALPEDEAAKLLWDIYSSTGNAQKQGLLLRDFSVLQELHPGEYGQYLFDAARYELFLDWCQQHEEPSVLKLQKVTARLCLDPQSEIELPDLEGTVTDAQAECFVRLIHALIRAERVAEAEGVLFFYFDYLLQNCSQGNIRRIMTADGALGETVMAVIQADALTESRIPIALYYYNSFGIGALSELADDYYNNYQKRCAGGPAEEQLAEIVRLSKLYPCHDKALAAQIYLLRVRGVLESESFSKETVDKLAGILNSCALEPDGVRELIHLIQDSPYAGAAAIYQSVMRLTDDDALYIDGLVYLHRTAMAISKQSAIEDSLYSYLCQRYLNALNRGIFPVEIGNEAETLCRRVIRSDGGLSQVVFCLYRIEMLLRQRYKAEYTLRYLAMQPADVLESKLYSIIEGAVEDLWDGRIPSILDLFRAVLQNETPEDVLAYCRFCGTFSEATGNDQSTMFSQIQNLRQQKLSQNGDGTSAPEYGQCAEADGDALIRILYSEPGKADYWWACTNLPGLSAAARGKLLYLCGKHNFRQWQECVQYCVKFELNDLLLRSLHKWVNSPSPGPQNCRTYLDFALGQDPYFFDRWSVDEDIQTLLDILASLCRSIGEDINAMPNTVVHSALNTISSIAVGLKADQAIEILNRYLYEPLLTSYSEVGVATVLRLLLADRAEQAHHLLEGLSQSNSPITCRLLIDSLSGLSQEHLLEWARKQENRLLIGLLLPDGNRPATKDIQGFALDMINKRRIQEGAAVLNQLLDIFPGDYACCDALFIFCKCGLEDPVPLLHKALCGMIGSSTNGFSYYRRDYIWNAKQLAAVNAIVKARRLEDQVRMLNNDYDFDQPAGTYCFLKKPETTTNFINIINNFQRDLTNDLANHQEDVLDQKCGGLLCWVTGNWTEFLYRAWLQKTDDTDTGAIRDILSMNTGSSEPSTDSIGFSRSLLRVLEQLDDSEWTPFLNWISLALTGSANPPEPKPWELRGKLRHLYLVKDLVAEQVCGKVGDLPLRWPLEEYSLFPLIFGKTVEPYVGTDPELLFNRLWLLGAVADYPVMLQYQYSASAQIAFRKGDDASAAAIYGVMQKLLQRGLYHSVTMSKQQFGSFRALYEAYIRISRLKLQDSETIEYVSSPGFNIWSCINMTVALLCSPRGNQAMQMSMWFTGANRELSQAIINGLNPDIPDEKKLESLENLPQNSLEQAYLAHLMAVKDKGSVSQSYFFQSPDISRYVKEMSLELARRYCPSYFWKAAKDSYGSRHAIITTFAQVNSVSYSQLEVSGPERSGAAPSGEPALSAQIPEETASRQDAQLPAFAKDLAPLEQTADLEKLEEDRAHLPHFKRYYWERLQLSGQIYRIALASNADAVDTLPALIDFGLDYYDYHADQGSPEGFSLASRAVIELVRYVDAVKSNIPAGKNGTRLIVSVKNLAASVENTILYSLLDKGHLTIHSLIDQFAQEREAFALMQDMVQIDSHRKGSTDTIYSALDLLVQSYSTDADNPLLLRKGLIQAQRLIGSISYGAWQPLKNKLSSLIQDEVNSMDRRPILSVRIFNGDQNPEDDYLYGDIQNDGMEAATDITLQVIYDGSSSDRYRLSSLAPKEHNVFKIRYTAPEGSMSLRYTVHCSYQFNGQNHTLSPQEDAIEICQVPEPTFPLRQYETQTITDFYEDAKGNIVNPNFFGRAKETAALRNLFRSGRFPSYNNAIVYGIRRAGKTTLLNYVRKYVNLRCDDAIVVKVDCLNNASSRLVQSLFIDRVIDAVQGEYPVYRDSEDWQRLRQEWMLPAGSTADVAPEKLELFYRELKRVTGKGLILMLDEVDNFFTAVEQQTSLDSSLFQVLSNMLCNPSCQECVHFILCGSKYLLRYRTGDGGISQLFQRFGSNIIEVGLIPKGEMRKMLLKPYKKYPEVWRREESIDWIWEYTQGLVWHVKLLANAVLEYVKDNGRGTVYPIDVKDKIQDIAQKEYCEQFFDGIGEKFKDRHERMVIDAMQSMASTRNTYIPRTILFQLLTSEKLSADYRMTQDQIETALSNLQKLQLIVYSEPDKGYRFPVDLYRLYFRTQREYPFIFKKMSDVEPAFIPLRSAP